MKISFIILFALISLLAINNELFAQDTTISLAFKNNRPYNTAPLYYQPDLSYQLIQQFNLIRKANAGDAAAQHELGIRYLLGENFPADTIQGAYWIQKSAMQNYIEADYNYAILLLNGWGVKWNPFKAYKYFLEAANNGMPQAQFVIGLFYTENLVIKRDWNSAYKWVKKAADADYKPAKKVLEEFKSKYISKIDTVTGQKSKSKKTENQNPEPLNSSTGLVFIDFDAVNDTLKAVSNKTLIEDLSHAGNEELINSLGLDEKKDTAISFTPADVTKLLKTAENGSPEALTLTGRMYEKGIYFKKDIITATAYYIRAIKLDSPRSPGLLWELINTPKYYDNLKTAADEKKPEALFSWYGLFALGMDNQLTADVAVNLLKEAASKYYLPAIVEMGLNFYTGKIIKKNKEKAISIWEDAKKLGSTAAKVRIASAKLYGVVPAENYRIPLDVIEEAEKQGSVLAQSTLAYCYRNGKGVGKDNAKAVKYYRDAAQRGSRFAYDELQKMYDEIRPDDTTFKIE